MLFRHPSVPGLGVLTHLTSPHLTSPLLRRCPATPNQAQAKLDRSLYDAVKKGKVEEAQRLLEMGADPEAPVGRKGEVGEGRGSRQRQGAGIGSSSAGEGRETNP